MIIKFIRNALGLIIVFIDWVSRPKAIIRDTKEQQNVQKLLDGHSLYQFYACPFCVKTRRAIHGLGIEIEKRDINKVPEHRADLETGGGHVKVPCLRIDNGDETQWMYESSDIIDYLTKRVA